MSTPSKYITLFVGNPGVGKSTGLNIYLQKNFFKSGVPRIGEHQVTSELQMIEEPKGSGKYYGDTPGLSDVDLRKKACSEITKALKQGGQYRLIFVLTLQVGRLLPDDVVSLNLILGSISVKVPYGIILNMLSPNEYEVLKEPSHFQTILASLFAKVHPTPFVLTLPVYSALLEQDNAVISIPELNRFLECIPFEELSPNYVQPLDDRDVDQLIQDSHKTLSVIREDSEKKREIFAQRMSELKTDFENSKKLQIQLSHELAVLKQNQKHQLRMSIFQTLTGIASGLIKTALM